MGETKLMTTMAARLKDGALMKYKAPETKLMTTLATRVKDSALMKYKVPETKLMTTMAARVEDKALMTYKADLTRLIKYKAQKTRLMPQWMTATVMVSVMMKSEALADMLMAKLPGLMWHKDLIKPEVSYKDLAVLSSLKHGDKDQVHEEVD